MITLTGEAKSTNNIYRSVCVGRFPRVYMTNDGKALKEDYQWQLKSQHKEPIFTYDIEMEIRLFFKRGGKHDIDNYNKIVLDAMSGIIFEDDSQITKLTVSKHQDKDNPRIEVEINKL